jgi:hypothetical protein
MKTHTRRRLRRTTLVALATATAVTAAPVLALALTSCETTSATGNRQKGSVPQSLKLRQSTMRY